MLTTAPAHKRRTRPEPAAALPPAHTRAYSATPKGRARAPRYAALLLAPTIVGLLTGCLSTSAGGGGETAALGVLEEYLGHIAAGEAEAASAMVDPAPDPDSAPFLTDETLGNAKERILVEELAVDEGASTPSQGLYTVNATLSLAGEAMSRTFHVYAEGEGWRIQESLGVIASVDASEFVDEVAIGEARLPLELGVGSFVIYPAVYEASASGTYVDVEPFEFVATEVDERLSVVTQANEAFKSLMVEMTAGYLENCVNRTAIGEEACPLLIDVNSSFVDLALTRVPTVYTLDGSSDFALTPGLVLESDPGQITYAVADEEDPTILRPGVADFTITVSPRLTIDGEVDLDYVPETESDQ